jgi:hypothetical protein
MRELLQTVLPAVLAALVAYQGGLTRTTRLRSMIRANVDLLGTPRPTIPAERHWRPTSASWSTCLSGASDGASSPSHGPACGSASTSPPPSSCWEAWAAWRWRQRGYGMWTRNRRHPGRSGPSSASTRPLGSAWPSSRFGPGDGRDGSIRPNQLSHWRGSPNHPGVPGGDRLFRHSGDVWIGGILLMLMDPLPPSARPVGLAASAALLVGSIGLFARWWRGSDLEEDEDDDQEPDLDGDRAPVPA